MALTIRVADLGADRERIIETLRLHLTPLSDAARFDWLYLANPDGPASAWFAIDEARDETVGMASAFPRSVVLDGIDARCWVLGDFCIQEQYRTLGPAVQLNRVCLSAVDRGDVAFCYDFPSRGMMAVYRRLGLHPFGEMTRFVKVLRWGPKLRAARPIPGMGAALGALGAIADLWPARPASPAPGVSLTLHEEACDESFDDLDRATRGRFRVTLRRSAAYLNWRYRSNPLNRYEILACRRGGELQGYAVFTQTGTEAHLADLVAREEGTGTLLLDDLTARLRARGTATLSAPVLASHPLIPLLQRSGFSPREASPVILYRQSGSSTKPIACGDSPLVHGDRDS